MITVVSPHASSVPVRASAEAGLARDLMSACLRPEDIQRMIAVAVQQSLSTHLLPTSGQAVIPSTRSDL